MENKKSVWGWVIAIIVILVIVGLVVSKKPAESGVVKIGVITPITGSGAGVYHEPLKKGIDIALAEINKNGQKVEVVYEDDQLDAKLSLSAYNKLKAEGIKYFVLNGSPSAGVVGPLVKQDGNLSMVPSALLTSYKDDSPLTCRIALTADNYGPAFTDLLLNKLGKKKVATLISNTEGAVAILNVFKDKFETAGGKVVLQETFEKDAIDFRTQITKIKADKDVEAVVIINWSNTIETMLKQMKDLGLNVPIIGDSPTIKNSALKNMALAEGVTFLDYSFATDAVNMTVTTKNFIGEYSKLYGAMPTVQAVQGYDLMKIMAYAIANSDSKNPASTADFIINDIKNYHLAGGDFSFDKSCEAKRDITVRKILDGKIVSF
jgi:branched-chain amino acid transport system substrate-binding protein